MTTHTQEASMAVSDAELAEKLEQYAAKGIVAPSSVADNLRLAAARLRETVAGRVQVKPLEWVGPNMRMWVSSPFPGLQYRIQFERGPSEYSWFAAGVWTPARSLDAAKAAVQSYHDASILSTLTQPQADEVTEDVLREARLNAKAELRTAFRIALRDLPEIAPPEVQSVLSSVHMRDEFSSEGKRLQMKHGTDAVAPRLEQECAAGAWSFMRNGVLAALQADEVTEAMVEAAFAGFYGKRWDGDKAYIRENFAPQMRAALLAALQAKSQPEGGE